jgi:hypothetical protein
MLGLDLNAKDANGKTPVQVATTEIRQYVRSLDLGDKYVVFRCSVGTSFFHPALARLVQNPTSSDSSSSPPVG